MMRKKRGFTLIEVLIVIGLLALISIPAISSYNKTQTRTRIGQAESKLIRLGTALESYQADFGKYPYDGHSGSGPGVPGFSFWYIPPHMTTPIAYVSPKDLTDPFRSREIKYDPPQYTWVDFRYINTHSTWGTAYTEYTGRTTPSIFYDDMLLEAGDWRVSSGGPDLTYGPGGWDGPSDYPSTALPLPYDPTNGLVSDGDIILTKRYGFGYGNM